MNSQRSGAELQDKDFELLSLSESKSVRVRIGQLIIAGWTGRNKSAMEEHMQELEKIGISRPTSAPIFYHLSPGLVTQDDQITVVGEDTSGEVEFFILTLEDGLWLGVASDHTDRKTEAYNVTISKQACAKPISKSLWRYEDVVDHWGELVMRSYSYENGQRNLYQEGPVTTMLTVEELLDRLNMESGNLGVNSIMFCGTLSVRGGIRAMDAFEIELEDPVLNRVIRHKYAVKSLLNVG